MTKLSDLNLHDVGNTINLAGTLWAGQDKLYLCVFPGEDTSGLVLDRLDLSPATGRRSCGRRTSWRPRSWRRPRTAPS